MIQALVTRCRSLGQRIERWLAGQMSHWARATVVLLLMFGVLLMLAGGELTVVITWWALVHLGSFNPLVIGSGPGLYRLSEASTLLSVLGLLFGGNFLRIRAFAELLRRTAMKRGLSTSDQQPKSTGQKDQPYCDGTPPDRMRPTTAVLCTCVGPTMFLWGALLLLDALKPSIRVFLYVPPSRWLKVLGSTGAEWALIRCQLWIAGAGLLLLGALMFWKGFRSLFWRPVAHE